MDLKQICDYVHNYFEDEYYEGEFVITGGQIDLSNVKIQENQYFKIEGSVFNDGIYKHTASNLADETFRGTITTMCVPKDVLDVLTEATEWEGKNATVLQSPFNSESFGGYSYSKGTSQRKDGSTSNISWRDIFSDRLKPYRKIG